jgi:hypothetical protein
MFDLKLHNVAFVVESAFVRPKPFSKDFLDKFVLKALETFQQQGLRPEHFSLQTVDVLFNYVLAAGIAQNGMSMQMTGTRLVLHIQNVMAEPGSASFAELIEKAYSLSDEGDFNEHSLRFSTHASFSDSQQRFDAHKILADPQNNIEFLGRLAHFQVPNWQSAVRLEIDRSLFFERGLFITWNSIFQGKLEVKTILTAMRALEVSARRFDFDFQIQ